MVHLHLRWDGWVVVWAINYSNENDRHMYTKCTQVSSMFAYMDACKGRMSYK